MSIIDIQHITKDYGEGRGVFDVSFQVHKGEVMGFLGPNGAGKTTTIRQLMGFLKPDSGNVRILGMDCFHDAHKIAGSLGYLPGEIAFIDSMSGTEFIRFIARMKEMKDTGRADELMKRFALDPSTKIKKMSKGTKQKIGIICAFMQDPDILLLDEPTSGLDPLMQNAFIELILEEKKRGKTILLSSHIFEEIEKTCDRAAIIRNGRLVAVEDMEHLAKNKQKLIDLPGEIAFIDSMSGTEFIRFIARMKEMKDTGRADELMKRFALDPSTKIKKMSKGTKQKIGIICAFMQDPDILLLDEPTSGLDPLMQNAFIELILEEKKRGKTILLSSHIFEEIEKTCDRAAIIRNGRLVAVEDMEHLAKNKQKLIDLRFPDENTARDFASSFQPDATSIVSVRQNGSLVTVQIKGNIDALIKAASRYTVNDLDIRTQTLEEIFMHFYGGDANA